MSEQIKHRVPGKRAFPADDYPKLTLVPPAQPKLPDVKTEFSPEVKEMLRERRSAQPSLNRRHAARWNTDTPDAA